MINVVAGALSENTYNRLRIFFRLTCTRMRLLSPGDQWAGIDTTSNGSTSVDFSLKNLSALEEAQSNLHLIDATDGTVVTNL